MKKIFVLLLILFSIKSFGQGADTIVTNLNVRASVVNTIASLLELNGDVRHLNAFIKYSAEYRDGNEPTGNTNVNIDTIYTSVLIFIYDKLRNDVSTQTEFNNFSTDITSKRNTNSFLDTSCDTIDASFTAQTLVKPAYGRKLLIGK